jgi:hypothetical protein
MDTLCYFEALESTDPMAQCHILSSTAVTILNVIFSIQTQQFCGQSAYLECVNNNVCLFTCTVDGIELWRGAEM